MKKSLLISFILHSLIFLDFSLKNKNDNHTQRYDKYLDVEIIPSSDILIEDEIENNKGSKKRKTDCKYNYGGIGVTTVDNTVTEVYPGYPADISGIIVGDIITNSSLLRGEPGTLVVVTIIRNNTIFNLKITRTKVCFNKK